MSAKKMTYDELYASMAKSFTIEKNNTDYTLGEYMLMRAKAKSETAVTVAGNSMPVVNDVKEPALVAAFTYVNEKLRIKEAPVKNRTIRSFPLRTSASAFCSALVLCALVIGCTFFGFKSLAGNTDNTVVVTENDSNTEAEDSYTENNVTNA